MANRLDIGEVVAAQMQQIVQSEEHKRVFFKGASEKCCSCTTCGKECSCGDKCGKDCKGCAGHVHDSNCAHDKTASAVNEMIDLLQKISSVQDELGLVNSSIFTMKALAMMVAELKKTAQVDTNDVSFEELVEDMPDESRFALESGAFDDPDIDALLRQRVQESHEGKEPAPFDFTEGVSADPTTPLPSSAPDPEFGEVVIEPEEHETWAPGSSRNMTFPAHPMHPGHHEGDELIQEIPIPRLHRPQIDRTYVAPGERVDIDENLPQPEMDAARSKPTVPSLQQHLGGGRWQDDPMDFSDLGTAQASFKRLNALMKKYAEEGDDFEDEPELDEDAELAALMKHVPGGRQMRGHELEEMLLGEEPYERDLFDVPLDADDNYASDLDEELENGDFLGSREYLVHDPLHEEEDAGHGFTQDPGIVTLPERSIRECNYCSMMGRDKCMCGPRVQIPFKDDIEPHNVRVGPGEWKKFDELSPEEKAEIEMGAGLREQLDMDPDDLSTEEVYPEEWADTEEEAFNRIRDELPSSEDDDYDPEKSRFWNDDE